MDVPAGSVKDMCDKTEAQAGLVQIVDRLHYSAANNPSVRLPCAWKAVRGTCTNGKCKRCRPAFGDPAKYRQGGRRAAEAREGRLHGGAA